MAAIIHPGRWGRNKPPLGSQIQFGHPLAQGLIGAWAFNERAGTKIFDLTGGGNHLTLTGNAAWGQFWNLTNGLYAPNSGTYTGAQIASPTSRLKPTTAVTVIWRGILHSHGLRDSHPMFFGCNYNTSGSAPYVSYSIGRRDSGTGTLTVFYSAGGSFTELSAANQLGPGNPADYFYPVNLGFSRRAGSTKIYRGSALVASDTVAGDLTYSAASTINLNHRNNATSNNSCDTTTDVVWVWDRALTADQFAWLDAEPYAFMRGPAPRRLWWVSSVQPITAAVKGKGKGIPPLRIPSSGSVALSAGSLAVVAVAADSTGTAELFSSAGVSNGSMSLDARADNAGHIQALIFSRAPSAAGDYYTVFTMTAPGSAAGALVELGNVAASSQLDKTAAATGSGTAPSSGATAATAQDYEIVLGAIATEGPGTDAPGTWGAGFQPVAYIGGAGGSATANVTLSLGHKTVSATGPQTAAKTGITGRYWSAAVATYKGLAAAAPATAPPVAFVTASPLADGAEHTAYSEYLEASGGVAPYTFALSSGTLPAGLTLASDGRISGTPTAAGSQTFSISVTDSESESVAESYSITIAAAEEPAMPTSRRLSPGTAASRTTKKTGPLTRAAPGTAGSPTVFDTPGTPTRTSSGSQGSPVRGRQT